MESDEKLEINLDGQTLGGLRNATFECEIETIPEANRIDKRIAKRIEILTKAEEIVTGEREDQYGSPEDSFSLISEFWSDYLGVDIVAEDVAAMMILMKLARIRGGGSLDSWIDIAGYAACGGEIFENSNE